MIEQSDLLALLARYRTELAEVTTERDVAHIRVAALEKEMNEVIHRLHTELLNSRVSMIQEQEAIWMQDAKKRAAHIERYLAIERKTVTPGFEILPKPITDEHSTTGDDHGKE